VGLGSPERRVAASTKMEYMTAMSNSLRPIGEAKKEPEEWPASRRHDAVSLQGRPAIFEWLREGPGCV